MKVLRSMIFVLFAAMILTGCQTKTETPAQSEGVAPQQEAVAVEQNPHTAAPEAVATDAAPEVAVPGVTSVADVFAKKADLDKKSITVSGKVVKVSKGILGSNWLHIQDGTGAAGTNDITVTTQAEPNVGDKVTATGIVALNKDFGAGYKYDIIVEKATVTKN